MCVQKLAKCSRGSKVIELSKLIIELEKYKLYYCLNTQNPWRSIVIMDCTYINHKAVHIQVTRLSDRGGQTPGGNIEWQCWS